jgi:hypothetical protein
MCLKQDYFVRRIASSEIFEWLENKHYAKRRTTMNHRFGLFNKKGVLLGVSGFGTSIAPPVRMGVCGKEFMDCVLEFNRLCVQEPHPRNLLSWFVSQCLSLLPQPTILVSYADADQGHIGFIYQATNWIYTGCPLMHHSNVILDGKPTHINKFYHSGLKNEAEIKNHFGERVKLESPKGKHRYIKFVGNRRQVRQLQSKLKWPILPYPKGESQRYDASYQPKIQIRMF